MARPAKTPDPDGLPDPDWPDKPLPRHRMINSKELLAFLGPSYTQGTLDQWASRGNGPPFSTVGNHRLYAPADVRTWLAGLRKTKSSDKGAAA